MLIDIDSEQYSVASTWPARAEDLEAIADRLRRFLDTLGKIHPTMQPWWIGYKRRAAYLAVRDNLATVIHRDITTDEMGQVEVKAGYAILGSTQGPRQRYMLVGQAGGTYDTFVCNELGLKTRSDTAVDKTILDYPVMKAVMLTTIACWEPTFCRVASGRFASKEPDAKYEIACWMKYVPPPNAENLDLVGVPFSEWTPDGGLLLSATDQAFDIVNPSHLAGSRAIDEATQHLNASGSTASNKNAPR